MLSHILCVSTFIYERTEEQSLAAFERDPAATSPGSSSHGWLYLHSNRLKGSPARTCIGHVPDTLSPHVAARSKGVHTAHFHHLSTFRRTVGQEDCRTQHPRGLVNISCVHAFNVRDQTQRLRHCPQTLSP